MSNSQLSEKLMSLLMSFIKVLKEKNIADIKPIPDMTDDECEANKYKNGRFYTCPPPQPLDEVKVLITLDDTQTDEFDEIHHGHNKLFLWDDSNLLGFHHIKDASNPDYKLIYKIINNELKLNGLKIIQIARWRSSPTTEISILMKKTDTSGVGGKQKQSRKRRKSTKKKNYIKKKNYTKKRR